MTAGAFPSDTDVLVAGAGPTGLALATSLRQLGADITIIDLGAEIRTDSRAAGVQPRTLQDLDRAKLRPCRQSSCSTDWTANVGMASGTVAAQLLNSGAVVVSASSTRIRPGGPASSTCQCPGAIRAELSGS